MEEIIRILNEFSKEKIKEIIEKAERKERLTNFELSLIYNILKWKKKEESRK